MDLSWKKVVVLLIGSFFLMAYKADKPKVLIIGDSISIGYFPFVKEKLSDEMILEHNEGNAKYTANGLNKIRSWLGSEKWDVIQFNWGLWDIAYRKSGNTGERTLTTDIDQYAKNLDSLVRILKSTGAKLIFVTTTYVPENSIGRKVEDPLRYNKVAVEIMKKNGVLVNDIYKASKKYIKNMVQV